MIDFGHNSKQERSERYATSERKTYKKQQKWKQYLVIIFLAMAVLPIFTMNLMAYLQGFRNGMDAFGYYNNFIKINSDTSKCAALLLNLNAYDNELFRMAISRNNLDIFMTHPQELFPKVLQCLINRGLESEVK